MPFFPLLFTIFPNGCVGIDSDQNHASSVILHGFQFSSPNTIRTETHFYAFKKKDGYAFKILNDLWKRMRDVERNRVPG